VLFLGGLIMLAAGLGILWTLRSLFRRPKIGEETVYLFEEASKARHSRIRGVGDDADEDVK
jgi:hypothetical protein